MLEAAFKETLSCDHKVFLTVVFALSFCSLSLINAFLNKYKYITTDLLKVLNLFNNEKDSPFCQAVQKNSETASAIIA